MAKQQRQDHYDVLGVKDDAPREVVAAAYKALRNKHTTAPDDVELRQVESAYRVLGDDSKRALYDELTRTKGESEPPGPEVESPRARADDATPATGDQEPEWRVGRLPYFTAGVSHALAALLALALGADNWSPTQRWTLVAMLLPSSIVVVRARLRDLGRDPNQFWLALIPLYNLYFGCVLLFSASATRGGRQGVKALGLTAGNLAVAYAVVASTTVAAAPRVAAAAPYTPPPIAVATAEPRTLRQLTPLEWQRCLIASDYAVPGGADGVWGPASQAAFDKFQVAHKGVNLTAEEVRRCWPEEQ